MSGREVMVVGAGGGASLGAEVALRVKGNFGKSILATKPVKAVLDSKAVRKADELIGRAGQALNGGKAGLGKGFDISAAENLKKVALKLSDEPSGKIFTFRGPFWKDERKEENFTGVLTIGKLEVALIGGALLSKNQAAYKALDTIQKFAPRRAELRCWQWAAKRLRPLRPAPMRSAFLRALQRLWQASALRG